VVNEENNEALWVLFDSGWLRAYNSWNGRPAAERLLDIPPGVRMLAGGQRLWLNVWDERLILIDPVTVRVVQEVALPRELDIPAVLVEAFAFGAVWVAKPGLLGRLGEAAASTAELPGDFEPSGLTAAGPWLWVGATDGRLARVDPATGEVAAVERLPAGNGGNHGDQCLAYGRAGLVATVCNQPDIFVLDPVTAQPLWWARVPDGSYIVSLYSAGADVWAVGSNGTAVLLGDAQQPIKATVEFSEDAETFPAAVAAGSLWIASEGDWQVTRIDPATGSVLAQIDWEPEESEAWANPRLWLEGGRSSLWGGNTETEGITRIDPVANRVVHLGRAERAVVDTVVASSPGQRDPVPKPTVSGRPKLIVIRGGG
jgi:hypothetical protein